MNNLKVHVFKVHEYLYDYMSMLSHNEQLVHACAFFYKEVKP